MRKIEWSIAIGGDDSAASNQYCMIAAQREIEPVPIFCVVVYSHSEAATEMTLFLCLCSGRTKNRKAGKHTEHECQKESRR